MINIINNTLGPIQTESYLIIDTEADSCLIIDTPAQSFDYYKDYLTKNPYKLKAVILTHSHWDHSGDVQLFKEYFEVPVFVSKLDEYRILNPAQYTIWSLPFEIKPSKADIYLEDVKDIEFDGIRLIPIHTPGHTEGSYILTMESEKCVFTGDTLFCEGVGRTDLPGGSTNELINSVRNKVYKLPENYIVYPGHGPTSQIGYEKYNNPHITIH